MSTNKELLALADESKLGKNADVSNKASKPKETMLEEVMEGEYEAMDKKPKPKQIGGVGKVTPNGKHSQKTQGRKNDS